MKRWISKSYSHCWKGIKYAENVGKPKNVQELEDFSEEQQAVKLLRTNKGLKNNYHKTERHRGSSRKRHTVLRFKGMSTFERGHFYKFSYYFVLWRIYKRVMWNRLFRTVLNKKITCNFHDPSYFVKMINIFHILKGICKLMSTKVAINLAFVYSYIACTKQVHKTNLY